MNGRMNILDLLVTISNSCSAVSNPIAAASGASQNKGGHRRYSFGGNPSELGSEGHLSTFRYSAR